MEKKGKVYLIGAGPGDPGLMTIKGLRLLGEADVVIYDYLVNTEILKYARKGSRLVYVGKKGGEHSISQAELNELLLAEATEGNVVARLKGGDPYIFGRGGEEAEVLAGAGIEFEVVPGVTSAIAAPAYAGIPLTHRQHASSLCFVTGHEDPAKDESNIDWKGLSGMGTVVFLMGVKNLPMIVGNLIAAGKSPRTPVALIRWGTTADQQTLTAELASIAEKAEKAGFKPPSIFVVGEVVNLRETLEWFEKKSLFGKGVVITRPKEQDAEFAELLEREGARVIHFPTIKIEQPSDWSGVDGALERIETFDWLIFTSANGVRFFISRLFEKGRDLRDLKGVKICCIGPATALEVAGFGIRVDIVPDEYISEGVVKSFKNVELKGKKILLPRAKVARDVIPIELEKMGADVETVVAYQTVGSGIDRTELDEYLKKGQVDVITFTSPSTVTGFIRAMGEGFELPQQVKIACIGPVTAEAAHRNNFSIDIMQDKYTISGLVNSISAYFKSQGGRGLVE